jgi:hypothetical protein
VISLPALASEEPSSSPSLGWFVVLALVVAAVTSRTYVVVRRSAASRRRALLVAVAVVPGSYCVAVLFRLAPLNLGWGQGHTPACCSSATAAAVAIPTAPPNPTPRARSAAPRGPQRPPASNQLQIGAPGFEPFSGSHAGRYVACRLACNVETAPIHITGGATSSTCGTESGWTPPRPAVWTERRIAPERLGGHVRLASPPCPQGLPFDLAQPRPTPPWASTLPADTPASGSSRGAPN